jgi:hypothetical protein
VEGSGHAGGEIKKEDGSEMSHETESIKKIYRDPLFERTLQELRSKGGYAAVAAGKSDAFIAVLCGNAGAGDRDKFRFTRNGEYRIKNCRKVDLGCGYRIVCIWKDQRLILLYIGTHDDCFRWIERHRTAEYDLDSVAEDAWMKVGDGRCDERTARDEVHEEDRFAEEYEASLMDRLDDAVLRQVFSGLIERR